MGGWTTFPFLLNRGWLICTCSKVAGMDVVRENIYLSGFLKCKLGLRCSGMKLTRVWHLLEESSHVHVFKTHSSEMLHEMLVA